jgi:eukaryotic-like serine/threonine-protein kinase
MDEEMVVKYIVGLVVVVAVFGMFSILVGGSDVTGHAFGMDADEDGIPNFAELRYGTDPGDADSDDDGIIDGEEINTYFTNPLTYDTDGDGFGDGDEVYTYATHPRYVRNHPTVVYVGSTDNYLYALLASDGSYLWSINTGNDVNANPVVVEGVLYFASDNNCMYAARPGDGAMIWNFCTGSDITATPVVQGDTVFIASYDHSVYAVNARTGDIRWGYETDAHISGSTPAKDGFVYAISYDGYVYALDALTGTVVWREYVGPSVSTPTIDGDFVYVASSGGEMFKFSARSGATIWSRDISSCGSPYYAAPTVEDDVVYIGFGHASVTCPDGLYALDAADGTTIWTFGAGRNVGIYTTPAIDAEAGIVYVGGKEPTDNSVFAVDISTGIPLWSFVAGSISTSGPILKEEVIYVGSYDYNIYALDAITGEELWSYETGDKIMQSSPFVYSN